MDFTITRKNGGVIAWTDEQVAYIKEKYTKENVSLTQLGNQFGCSYATIRGLLNKNGIKSQGNKRGYPRDSNYFNLIDSKDKAYWLGFMYADGCVHTDRNEVSINITDREHVEKFKAALGAINHKITVSYPNNPEFKNPKPLYQFSIKDKQLHEDLIKWGCIPQKSLKLQTIPNIPRNYVSHFLRGYFDGDGSLHWVKATNNYRISFLGTSEFLADVQKETGTQQISLQPGTGKAYVLQISGRKQVIRVLEYLYQDSTELIRLDRKYEKYLECVEWALPH